MTEVIKQVEPKEKIPLEKVRGDAIKRFDSYKDRELVNHFGEDYLVTLQNTAHATLRGPKNRPQDMTLDGDTLHVKYIVNGKEYLAEIKEKTFFGPDGGLDSKWPVVVFEDGSEVRLYPKTSGGSDLISVKDQLRGGVVNSIVRFKKIKNCPPDDIGYKEEKIQTFPLDLINATRKVYFKTRSGSQYILTKEDGEFFLTYATGSGKREKIYPTEPGGSISASKPFFYRLSPDSRSETFNTSDIAEIDLYRRFYKGHLYLRGWNPRKK